MKQIVVAGFGFALALVGCGGSDQVGGSMIMGSGGAMAGTGGSGFDPIGSAGGGAAGHGGSSGASGSSTVLTGGSGGTGGSESGSGGAPIGGSAGSAGANGTPGYPSGPVTLCFGQGCPKGECDNDLFFADTACSALFTTDAGPDFPYCNAGENGSYCVEAGTSFVNPDYSVTCVGGKATVLMCANGCGSFGDSASQCD